MTTAQALLNKALKYRRMASAVSDPIASDSLTSLAAECAAKAGKVDEAEREVARANDAKVAVGHRLILPK